MAFNVDKIKLGQLPGIFNRVKAEGGFFKLYSDAWNNKCWDTEDYSAIGCGVANETWQEYLNTHYHGWADPNYANVKTSATDVLCRVVVVDSSNRDIAIGVVYDKNNKDVICWWLNAD